MAKQEAADKEPNKLRGVLIMSYETDDLAEVAVLSGQEGGSDPTHTGDSAVFELTKTLQTFVQTKLADEAAKLRPAFDAVAKAQAILTKKPKAKRKPKAEGEGTGTRGRKGLTDENIQLMLPRFRDLKQDKDAWTKDGNLSQIGLSKMREICKATIDKDAKAAPTLQKYAKQVEAKL